MPAKSWIGRATFPGYGSPDSADVKPLAQPGFPNKPPGAARGAWIFGWNIGSRSVLHRDSPSFRSGCTPGESWLEAVQPWRVVRLSSGQAGAPPPDKVAGGRPQHVVRSAAPCHPAGPHASARMV